MKNSYRKTISIVFALGFFILLPGWAAAQLPQTGPTSWSQVFSGITQYVFQLGMAVAVIVIISSGVMFMTAGGNEDRVTKAKTTFFWALVGLAICLLGSGLVYLILNVMGGQNLSTGTGNSLVSPTYTTQTSQSLPSSGTQGSQVSQDTREQLIDSEIAKAESVPEADKDKLDLIDYSESGSQIPTYTMGASDQQQVDSLLQKSDEAFRKLPSDWQDKLGAVNVVGMSGESFTQYMEGVVDNWQKNGEVSAQEAQQLKDNYTGSTAIFDTSSNSMIINLDNPHSDGLAGTCLHEYAHAIDNYGAWATYAENDDYSSIYQKSLSLAGGADSESSRGFVSGYAKVNIGEDFAETVKVYYESGGNPAAITPDQNAQKLIQERFNFLEKNGIVSLSAR